MAGRKPRCPAVTTGRLLAHYLSAIARPSSSPRRGSGLLRSSAAVGAGTLLSRLSGLLRVFALAYALGTTGLSDLYNLANTTPNLIYELVLGGVLSATIVPLVVRRIDEDDTDGISAVMSVAAACLVGLTVAAVLAAPLLLRAYLVLRPDAMEGDTFTVGVALMRWFLPQILFYGFTTLGTALLHATKRFALPAFVPVLNNILVSIVLVLAARLTDLQLSVEAVGGEPGTIALLGLGTTLGVVAMTVALLPAVRSCGVPLRWNLDWRNPAVREVAKLSTWTIGYVVANQVALIVIQALALSQPGVLSAYTFAFIFFQLPHGLVSVSVMTTFLPDLAKAAAAERWASFTSRMGHGIRLIAALVIPAAAGYLALAPRLIGLLQRGQFDAASTSEVSGALIAFAPGIIGFSVYLFAIRGFYALSDTRTPFLLNLGENALNVVAAAVAWFLLSRSATALAAGYSLAYVTAAVAALTVLRRRVGAADSESLTLRALAIFSGAALVMVVALRVLAADLPLLLAILLGAVVYSLSVLGAVVVLDGPDSDGGRRARAGAPRRR